MRWAGDGGAFSIEIDSAVNQIVEHFNANYRGRDKDERRAVLETIQAALRISLADSADGTSLSHRIDQALAFIDSNIRSAQDWDMGFNAEQLAALQASAHDLKSVFDRVSAAELPSEEGEGVQIDQRIDDLIRDSERTGRPRDARHLRQIKPWLESIREDLLADESLLLLAQLDSTYLRPESLGVINQLTPDTLTPENVNRLNKVAYVLGKTKAPEFVVAQHAAGVSYEDILPRAARIKRETVVLCQSLFRGHRARREVRIEKKRRRVHKAAVALQALVRGTAKRKKHHYLKVKNTIRSLLPRATAAEARGLRLLMHAGVADHLPIELNNCRDLKRLTQLHACYLQPENAKWLQKLSHRLLISDALIKRLNKLQANGGVNHLELLARCTEADLRALEYGNDHTFMLDAPYSSLLNEFLPSEMRSVRHAIGGIIMSYGNSRSTRKLVVDWHKRGGSLKHLFRLPFDVVDDCLQQVDPASALVATLRAQREHAHGKVEHYAKAKVSKEAFFRIRKNHFIAREHHYERREKQANEALEGVRLH